MKRWQSDMNKEALEYRLHELENELSFNRATGKTKRIVNDIIEEFFQKPIGTLIEIYDHYMGVNFGYDKEHKRPLFDTSHAFRGCDDLPPINTEGRIQAERMVGRMVKNRLDHEYHGVEYELNTAKYPFTIIRKSETMSERLQREINEIKEKLNND